jgi:hypothetical protein
VKSSQCARMRHVKSSQCAASKSTRVSVHITITRCTTESSQVKSVRHIRVTSSQCTRHRHTTHRVKSSQHSACASHLESTHSSPSRDASCEVKPVRCVRVNSSQCTRHRRTMRRVKSSQVSAARPSHLESAHTSPSYNTASQVKSVWCVQSSQSQVKIASPWDGMGWDGMG